MTRRVATLRLEGQPLPFYGRRGFVAGCGDRPPVGRTVTRKTEFLATCDCRAGMVNATGFGCRWWIIRNLSAQLAHWEETRVLEEPTPAQMER